MNFHSGTSSIQARNAPLAQQQQQQQQNRIVSPAHPLWMNGNLERELIDERMCCFPPVQCSTPLSPGMDSLWQPWERDHVQAATQCPQRQQLPLLSSCHCGQ